MRINPPEAVALATIYQLWKRSHRTDTWIRLGDALAILVRETGSWDNVHQFCADHLGTIPTGHFKLAYADHVRRTHLALVS